MIDLNLSLSKLYFHLFLNVVLRSLIWSKPQMKTKIISKLNLSFTCGTYVQSKTFPKNKNNICN